MTPANGQTCECPQGEYCHYATPIDPVTCPSGGSGTLLDPYCGLQNAIDHAPEGHTVLALPGDYDEGRIRVCERNVIIRSCDGPQTTTVRRTGSGSVFLFQTNAIGPSTVLEGFTITGAGHSGIFIAQASPTIRANIITRNTGDHGGGINADDAPNLVIEDNRIESNHAGSIGGGVCLVDAGSPVLRNNIITGNTAVAGGGGVYCASGTAVEITDCEIFRNTAAAGGGIYCAEASPAMIRDCAIFANTANGANEDDHGGGGVYMHADTTAWPSLIGCTIEHNEALGIAAKRGGGVYVFNGLGSAHISHCVITDNLADFGAGIGVNLSVGPPPPGEPVLSSDCSDGDYITIEHTLIARNGPYAQIDEQSGLWLSNQDVRLVNCTIADNGIPGAYEVYSDAACVEVHNCIFGENDPPSRYSAAGVRFAEFYFAYSLLASGLNACDDLDGDSTFMFDPADGNLDTEPNFRSLFRSPPSDDWRLHRLSCAIDAGKNALVLPDTFDLDVDTDLTERVPLDLDFLPRFFDFDLKMNTGVPDPPTYPQVVDMGAYEYEPIIVSADPPDGTIDARRPFDPYNPTVLEGIGTAEEPILIELSDEGTCGLELTCWSLCETGTGVYGTNSIAAVTNPSGNTYQIVLARAITPGEATTIEYMDGSFVTYYAHPANVDGSSVANLNDITAWQNCQVGNPPAYCTIERTDIDRSGAVNLWDQLELIDLLNGAGEFEVWLGTTLPAADGCPSDPVACEPPALERLGGAMGDPELDQLAMFTTAMVEYLVGTDLGNPVQAEVFGRMVTGLCTLAHNAFSDEECYQIACVLQDPELVFLDPTVESRIPQIVALLED